MTATLARGGAATDVTTVNTTATEDDVALPVIEFRVPIPGFPDHREFVLVAVAEDGPLFALRSVDDPDLRFLVVPPAPFFPDYAPQVGTQVLEQLGTEDPADLLVLLVVTASGSVGDATANLLAPVIVDRSTRRAAQVILEEDQPIRARLLPA
ncbi:flagellar assembly protein FliW [Actinokineospora auranticolor]|uniref:Flagellar assembly factor FliW n=1 Tax=Actinokineospora auranticolor TaxID=155976 RepID=A0A2S6GML1_9PSEU|nr:flagellar assembly protein FliW [Actinokineospora auranticolor]PPK66465.1 flagellar assembly factor FliW [Actinokineospora auranticolor]